MVEEAIKKIGLPVRCHICKERGFIKPQTNLGGWYRARLFRSKWTWYCPKDYPGDIDEKIRSRYATPVKQEDEMATVEEQLYKLLD
ncbi:MAG TPA: hypothetical protein PLJ04_03530 [Candidatus Saccharibacteria bacterium]|nr:hypothetical protein [Candidatus Saccharibacteria bacterium]